MLIVALTFGFTEKAHLLYPVNWKVNIIYIWGILFLQKKLHEDRVLPLLLKPITHLCIFRCARLESLKKANCGIFHAAVAAASGVKGLIDCDGDVGKKWMAALQWKLQFQLTATVVTWKNVASLQLYATVCRPEREVQAQHGSTHRCTRIWMCKNTKETSRKCVVKHLCFEKRTSIR